MRVEVIGDATLILGNCIELMPTLEPVDHIIADGPYEKRLHDAKAKLTALRTDGGPELEPLDFGCIDPIRADFVRLSAEICSGWFLSFCTAEGIAKWADEINLSSMKYKRACVCAGGGAKW